MAKSSETNLNLILVTRAIPGWAPAKAEQKREEVVGDGFELVGTWTPAKAAQQVAARAADMARKGYLRVAGVVENMGPSVDADGTVTAMFGSGGGQELADMIGVPLLASVPLDASVAAAGDSGLPVALDDPENPASVVFRDLAKAIVEDVAPPVKIADCSLRGALTRAGADLDAARARAHAR